MQREIGENIRSTDNPTIKTPYDKTPPTKSPTTNPLTMRLNPLQPLTRKTLILLENIGNLNFKVFQYKLEQ